MGKPGSTVSGTSECSCPAAVVSACGAPLTDTCACLRRSSQSSFPTVSLENFGDTSSPPRNDSSLTEALIVDALPLILDLEAERNGKLANIPSWEEAVSVFFSVTKPQIATRSYLTRLVKYAHCSPAAFVIVLVYLERLEAADAKLKVTAYNMHRLVITALMLAAKMLDDRCFSNAHYARVGGIASVKEMNRLEIQMLILLKYNLNVTPEEFHDYVGRLHKAIAPTSPTTISCRTTTTVHSPYSSSSQLASPIPYVSSIRTYSNLHTHQYGVPQQYVEQPSGYEAHPHGYEAHPQYVHYHHTQTMYPTPYNDYACGRGRICPAET